QRGPGAARLVDRSGGRGRLRSRPGFLLPQGAYPERAPEQAVEQVDPGLHLRPPVGCGVYLQNRGMQPEERSVAVPAPLAYRKTASTHTIHSMKHSISRCVVVCAAFLGSFAQAQVTQRVSVSSSGAQGDGACRRGSPISSGGRFVAFASSAT